MTPFETFVLPARARPALWRFVLGSVLILIFYALGIAAIIAAAPLVWTTGPDYFDNLHIVLRGMILLDSPQGVLALLATYVGIWVGVPLAGWLHGQSFGRFFSPMGGGGFAAFVKGAGLGGIAAFLSTIAAMLITNDVRPGLDLGPWVMFLLPVIMLVFIQATAEELIFRGYLLQQLAARSRHWLVWAFIPSILFGSLHFSGDLPDGGGFYYVVNTFLFGLVCCVLVRRSGSLWPAVGLHVAANVVSLTFTGMDGIATGTQLWLFGQTDLIPLMRVDFVVTVLMLGFVLSPFGGIFEKIGPDPVASESE